MLQKRYIRLRVVEKQIPETNFMSIREYFWELKIGFIHRFQQNCMCTKRCTESSLYFLVIQSV